MSPDGIALITSRHWEGAYVLKELVEANIACTDVLIQPRWWGEAKDRRHYTVDYLAVVNAERSGGAGGERTHFTLEELARGTSICIHHLDDVNTDSSFALLLTLNPSVIVVVGAPIIRQPLVGTFRKRIINFHTGVLPEFRGPYSEFWAFYENSPHAIGTTIHLIDEGIDTGPVLGIHRISPDGLADPFVAHIANTKEGARFLPGVVRDYLAGRIAPRDQDGSRSRYYKAPPKTVVDELRCRLGRPFPHRFAE